MKTTAYFEHEILVKRPYLRWEQCEEVLRRPDHRLVQTSSRIIYWLWVQEAATAEPQLKGRGRYLRVVTEADGETLHNAMPGRIVRPAEELERKLERATVIGINYYEETDSLYISLSERLGADVVFISESVSVDVDESEGPVGIDIDSGASQLADRETLTSDSMDIERVVARGRERDKILRRDLSSETSNLG